MPLPPLEGSGLAPRGASRGNRYAEAFYAGFGRERTLNGSGAVTGTVKYVW